MAIDSNAILQLLMQLQGGGSPPIHPSSGLQDPSLSGLPLGEQGQGFGGGGSLLGGARGGRGAEGGAGLDLLSLLLAAGPQAQATGVGGEGGGALGGGGGGGTLGQLGGGTLGQTPPGLTLPSPPTPPGGQVPPPSAPPDQGPGPHLAFPPPQTGPGSSGDLSVLHKILGGGIGGLLKALTFSGGSVAPPVFGPGGAPPIPGELGPAGGPVTLGTSSPPSNITPGGVEPPPGTVVTPPPDLAVPPPFFGPGGAPPLPGEFGPGGGIAPPLGPPGPPDLPPIGGEPPPPVTPGGVEPPPVPPDGAPGFVDPGGGSLPADFPGSDFIGKLGGAATVGQGLAKLFGGGTGTQRGVGGAQGALGLISLLDPEPISKIFLTALGTVLGLIGGGRSNDFNAAQTEAALRQTGASVRQGGPLEQLVFERALDRDLFQNIGQFDPTVGPAPFGALPTTTPSGAPLSVPIANQLQALLRDPKGVLGPTDVTGILSQATPDDALNLLFAINEQRRLRTYAGLPTLAAPPPSIESAIPGANESPLLQALRRRLQPPTVDPTVFASA